MDGALRLTSFYEISFMEGPPMCTLALGSLDHIIVHTSKTLHQDLVMNKKVFWPT